MARRAALTSVVAMKRCTAVWSPPAVAMFQARILSIVPTTVTRVFGSKLKKGCGSQLACHSVGNQPKPPDFHVTVTMTSSAPPNSRTVCMKSVTTTARRPPRDV